jgi:hypothetical protein
MEDDVGVGGGGGAVVGGAIGEISGRLYAFIDQIIAGVGLVNSCIYRAYRWRKKCTLAGSIKISPTLVLHLRQNNQIGARKRIFFFKI